VRAIEDSLSKYSVLLTFSAIALAILILSFTQMIEILNAKVSALGMDLALWQAGYVSGRSPIFVSGRPSYKAGFLISFAVVLQMLIWKNLSTMK
jgi:hypothetical protein